MVIYSKIYPVSNIHLYTTYSVYFMRGSLICYLKQQTHCYALSLKLYIMNNNIV